MLKNIKLDNNYYFVQITDINLIKYETIDIKNINYPKINTNNILLLKIDFSTINESSYKKILKTLIKLKKKRNFGIKDSINNTILLGYLLNYCEENTLHNDFLSGINAILYNNTIDMYNYIYDTVCDYLDNQFISNNLCDFKNDKCGEKRNTSSTIGCCNHYKNKILGPLSLKSPLVPCEFLHNKKCTTKCLSCKLFTCDYLKKKGINFKIKNILLLDTFFNVFQKYIIKISVFTRKEEIIRRLLFFNI